MVSISKLSGMYSWTLLLNHTDGLDWSKKKSLFSLGTETGKHAMWTRSAPISSYFNIQKGKENAVLIMLFPRLAFPQN
jgi:hypothetical protein